MPIQLQLRRGLASQWLEANATLNSGEIGYETDTGFFKIGTGNTAWANLNYTVSNTALTANNALFLNGNSALTLRTYTDNTAAIAYSNATTYTDTRIGVVNTAITANADTAFANAAADATVKATAAIIYADFLLGVANTAIVANAATTYTNATTFSANATNLTNGTIPYGRFPANIVNTTSDFTRTGVTTFNANLVISTTAGISANGGYGTQGQALLSNGTSVYWATATAGTNTQIQFNDSGAANASAGFTFNKTSNTISIGNGSVNATINSTAYTGSASFVGGNTAATLRTYSETTASNAYSNAVTYVDTRIGVVNTAITANASAAYSNAVTYTDTKIGTANTAMVANAAAAYTNAVSYVDTRIGVVNTAITANASAAYSNAVSYVDSKLYVNTSQLSSNLSNYLLLTGGTVSGPLTVNNNLTVTGNLTLSGNTLIVGANNLIISDALISLHTNSTLGALTSNDGKNIGLAFHYYDTSDKHALLYRENSSGRLQYHTDGDDPQSNANPQGSNLGIIQAASFWSGNASVYATVNATNYTGTANNTSYVGAVSAANVVSNSQLSSNLANYQTTAGLAGNVATLTSNNTSFVGTVSAANVVSNAQLSANLANYVTATNLTNNLANYQTSAGLSSNVATLTANNTSFVGSVSAANVVSNSQLSANLANYVTATNLTNNLANYQTSAGLAGNVATLTANNTSFVGSVSAANVVSNAQLSANLGNYQTTAGLAANVATLTANLANYIVANTGIVSNSSGVFVNSSYISSITTVNANTANNSLYLGGIAAAGYQTTAGLAANVATLTANNTSFVGSISAANVVSNAQLSANLANYQTIAGMSAYQTTASLSSNVATLTANNTTYFNGQLASYYTNATNITSGTLPYAQIPANIVNTTSSFTITGVHTHNANVILGAGLSANGGYGTSGQVLTTNGSATYWSTVVTGGTDSTAQYTWSNTQTFTNTITFNSTIIGTVNNALYLGGTAAAGYQTTAGLSANVATLSSNNASYLGGVAAASYVNTSGTYTISGVHNHTANVSVNGAIIANGAAGSAGQVLTSAGSGNVYWATAASGGFTNGQSIAVSNLAVTGLISANGGFGIAGQVLTSSGSGNVYWSTVSGGGGGSGGTSVFRQTYIANGSTNTFTVATGYTANNLDVFLNGIKLQQNIEANVQNGSTFTILGNNPPNNSVIEVVGLYGTPTVDYTKYVKTFNLVGNFSAVVTGVARYVPLTDTVFTTIRLTNSLPVVGADIIAQVYKNGAYVNSYTLSSGSYTQLYTGQSISITTADYLTINISQGSGKDFSLTISN